MLRSILLVLILAVACDARTTPAGAATTAGSPRPSKLGETCSATADCEDPLRCVAATCTPGDGSRLGELYWSMGQLAGEKGQPTAGGLFQQALGQFEADHKPVPAGLLCDYGAALRRQVGDAKAGEQAARLLHRCLLSTPSGSADHVRALRELAELAPRGLDPQLIARDSPADSYMVNKPARAPSETLKVEVARTLKSNDRGYEAWAKRLEGPDARAALVKCYEAYWDATLASKLAISLPLKLSARTGDDDEYVGGTLELQADPTVSGPEAAAQQCVRTGLQPLAVEQAKSGSSGSWTGTVVITLTAAP